MKCDCCGKKKRLFESYAAIKLSSGQLYLCASCNDLMYKLRDAEKDNDKEAFDSYRDQLEQKSDNAASKRFVQWSNSLLQNWMETFQDTKSDDV